MFHFDGYGKFVCGQLFIGLQVKRKIEYIYLIREGISLIWGTDKGSDHLTEFFPISFLLPPDFYITHHALWSLCNQLLLIRFGNEVIYISVLFACPVIRQAVGGIGYNYVTPVQQPDVTEITKVLKSNKLNNIPLNSSTLQSTERVIADRFSLNATTQHSSFAWNILLNASYLNWNGKENNFTEINFSMETACIIGTSTGSEAIKGFVHLYYKEIHHAHHVFYGKDYMQARNFEVQSK